MGNKPLRPCRRPGCCTLVVDGYCLEHQPKRVEYRSDPAKDWHKLYKLGIWTEKLRPERLAIEPWCRECSAAGLRVKAEEVDHIIPHRGNMALFADPSNLQSLCHSCHSRKTMRELKENKQKKSRG